MLICNNCNATINQESKFCPQCGDPVDEKDIVSNALDNNVANVILTFGYSSSSNYEKALSIFKNLPTYSFTGDDKKIIHRATLPITEIDLIINIYDLIGSWKTSQMLINGRTCTKRDLVYDGIGCFRTRLDVPDKNSYCYGIHEYERNIWGCKKLGMQIYPYGGGWLEYGSFDDKGVWHFNKNRIRAELERKIINVELCPVFNKARVYKSLDLIPNSIDPKYDKNWEYIESYFEINGQYKKVAKGIKPSINQIFYLVPDEDKPDWDFSTTSGETMITRIEVNIEDIENLQRNDSIYLKILKKILDGLLLVGIIILPFIFSWFTLKKRYSKNYRLFAFSWLIIYIFIIYNSGDKNKEKDMNTNQNIELKSK
ncbi:zinc-ribbon domain-containing protein [Aliarcobacter lanthieri]|uniref:zinc ribbon domain-containing protein n=1 Tax=Aliarcobacter lanthieri TaxID=1355374 RepID=UPI003AAB8C85